MNINTNTALIKLYYNKYVVVPMKSFCHVKYRCDNLKEAEFWAVQSEDDTLFITLAEFKEQDEAHQFAELLTECLTKIKSFTDEKAR